MPGKCASGSADPLCVPAVTEGIVGAVLGIREVRKWIPFCDPLLKGERCAHQTHNTLRPSGKITELGKLMVIQYLHHTLKKVKGNIKGNRISKAVNMIYTQGAE